MHGYLFAQNVEVLKGIRCCSEERLKKMRSSWWSRLRWRVRVYGLICGHGKSLLPAK